MNLLEHAGNEFLDLPSELTARDAAAAVVFPIPYEATTSYTKGTEWGPAAIIEASSQVEWYDETHGDEPCRKGIHTLPPLDCRGTPEDVIDRIAREVSSVRSEGRFVLSLGGEHTVSIGCVAGVAVQEDSLTVVHVDAHADLRDEYEGSPWSHACVMRRIVDRHPIVQVGTRSLSEEEAEFVERKGIPVVSGQDIAEARSDPEGVKRWIDTILANIRTERVYLTLDLDSLDPSIMPAVGTPEPGGLLWHEAIALVDALFRHKEVLAADLVELCPIPGFVAPDFIAARLAYKIVGQAIRSRHGRARG